jgi:hypothetical protein
MPAFLTINQQLTTPNLASNRMARFGTAERRVE